MHLEYGLDNRTTLISLLVLCMSQPVLLLLLLRRQIKIDALKLCDP